MTDRTQPEALRLAALLDADEWPGSMTLVSYARACAAELCRQHAENERLQQELIRESHRTAEQKLRADQVTRQHADQAAMNREARAKLAALVEAQQPAPSGAADLIAALEEARSAINSMKVEAETAGQGDEQMMLEACETISNEGLQADMAIRAALASAPKPSSTPQADSQPAAVRDYPPLPDFETVEQHIYGACRRYITHDMLEPIHNLIRDAIDADRAQAAGSVTAPLSDAQWQRIADLEARQASAFRPGKESAKPVRASLGATDQSAAVAQEHQPCARFCEANAFKIELRNLQLENFRLREAICRTLQENEHLADGEDCTLIHIKRTMQSNA